MNKYMERCCIKLKDKPKISDSYHNNLCFCLIHLIHNFFFIFLMKIYISYKHKWFQLIWKYISVFNNSWWIVVTSKLSNFEPIMLILCKHPFISISLYIKSLENTYITFRNYYIMNSFYQLLSHIHKTKERNWIVKLLKLLVWRSSSWFGHNFES